MRTYWFEWNEVLGGGPSLARFRLGSKQVMAKVVELRMQGKHVFLVEHYDRKLGKWVTDLHVPEHARAA